MVVEGEVVEEVVEEVEVEVEEVDGAEEVEEVVVVCGVAVAAVAAVAAVPRRGHTTTTTSAIAGLRHDATLRVTRIPPTPAAWQATIEALVRCDATTATRLTGLHTGCWTIRGGRATLTLFQRQRLNAARRTRTRRS
jgi:hypothetical protein